MFAMTAGPSVLNLCVPMGRQPKDTLEPGAARHPQFAKHLVATMERLGLEIVDIATACRVHYETARLWTLGKSMPKRQKLDVLAKLLGQPASQLAFPDEGKPPGVALMPIVDVTPDEQRLIDMYRRMPEPAKKALRGRASELLEAFGKASKANPFGKGHTQ